MNEMINWYVDVLKKYTLFSGRAARPEFWYFTLVNFLISVVLSIIDTILGTTNGFVGLFGAIYSLAVLLPSIGVGIRRLHDTNRSGWFLLLGFIPIVGAIILIVFWAQEGQPDTNQYGPSPKGMRPQGMST